MPYKNHYMCSGKATSSDYKGKIFINIIIPYLDYYHLCSYSAVLHRIFRQIIALIIIVGEEEVIINLIKDPFNKGYETIIEYFLTVFVTSGFTTTKL